MDFVSYYDKILIIMTKLIKIFDTTLRDGEQAPGCSLNIQEKLEIARQLARLNVDIIEAGFPISSPGDFESVKAIAINIKGPVICGLARCQEKDIKAAADAVKYAEKPRIHVFIATSPVHMKYKLKKSPEDVLKTAVKMVEFAKTLCKDVQFSAEDAGRSDPKFLYKIVKAVIDAGATVVNIPDTVGYTMPEEFGCLISDIIKNVPKINKIDLAVHCHNDLGLSVANSLAAVKAGANQVECTINGLGERAGNAALEEIVMGIETRKSYFNVSTNINTKEIYKTSRLVSNLTGMIVQANKAVVGANAFAHEAGIHQDGVLKERTTYEIMNPSDVGLTKSEMVLGKHSGRHAFADKLITMGYDLPKKDIEKAFNSFKDLADKKKEVSDRDIESLIKDEISVVPETYKLDYLHVASGTEEKPKATIRLTYKDKTIEDMCEGDGPVDAVYKTIEKLTGIKATLVDYIIQAITGGTDALGEVTVRIKKGNNIYSGHGAHTDIIISSAKAYLNAINKLIEEN